MLSNITEKEHKRFTTQLHETLKKFEEINEPVEDPATQKYSDLVESSRSLEETYKAYLLKVRELRNILDEYEKKKKDSRILLRKLQLWFKYVFAKRAKNFLD